ncbi:MAG: protein-L-isoaspartate(D-aspartate) O-methyltransferase [Halanaerobiaceae bacterium]
MKDFASLRERMVEDQLVARGIEDENLLSAFSSVPRHEFVPEKERGHAYEDRPLPIGQGQTISQPYIVAEMISALELEAGDRLLEIGLGSGYAAAIMAEVANEVFAVERLAVLVRRAREKLAELEYDNIEVKTGDGTEGWPEKAPFDGILVSAAAPEVPETMLEQLDTGGVLVIPAGDKTVQQLLKITREDEGKYRREKLGGVRFVPLVGRYGWKH